MRKFGLIGFPLSHSFSPEYFNTKFKKLGIADAQYQAFPLPTIEEFPELIQNNPDLLGLNVTIPYKESVLKFVEVQDHIVSKIGAANTLKIKKGKIQAFNTDVHGFGQSIKPFLETHHTRALVLGSGGASKAVKYVLNELGIEYYTVSRNSHGPRSMSYSEINEHVIKAFPFIINCTPVGMYPNLDQFPELPYLAIGPDHFLYDLIYNPEETIFLKKGREMGAQTMNGKDMLVLQAEKSWDIWNDIQA